MMTYHLSRNWGLPRKIFVDWLENIEIENKEETENLIF